MNLPRPPPAWTWRLPGPWHDSQPLGPGRGVGQMDPGVGTGGKFPDVIAVAIGAGLIADVMSAGNFRRRQHGAGERGAGKKKQQRRAATRREEGEPDPSTGNSRMSGFQFLNELSLQFQA